jgi:aryl-alcohol dehydrogenase-like predicted oxidoreductase
VSRLSRRELLILGAAGLGAAALRRPRAEGSTSNPNPSRTSMLTRKIPRSGEAVPAIGLGTWQTFDVGADPAERAPLAEVLRRFLAGGGTLIDSSPMYGRAEEVVGDLLARAKPPARPFLATKVWTRGREAGEAQLEASVRRMRARPLDLAQVHNLLDVETHLPTLRAWKAAGRIRYLGITHYTASAFDDLERLLRAGPVDFVQLPYSVATRGAEARLLPAAAETGTAVLVNRPFEEGELFRRVKGRPLPDWAAELGCTAWSQVFLKFILAHPAVTCVIPATSKPAHLDENLRAGHGPLPDAALLRRIVRALDP